MNAKDVMSKEPQVVRMVDRLDAVARILWDQDCGFVPVVDGANVLVGVLTDRDLCMATYTQGRTLAEIPVLAVMARQLTTCRPEDSVAKVMQAMQKAQVHRVPVVDARGVLQGILAINDLLRWAKRRPGSIDAAQLLDTVAAVAAPRRGAVVAAKQPEPVQVVLAPAVMPPPAPKAVAPAAPPAKAAEKVSGKAATKSSAPSAKPTPAPAKSAKTSARKRKS